MSYSNGKVSAPVSVYDVQRALGDNSASVKNLCVSDAVNMWSKVKPVEPAPSSIVLEPLVMPASGISDDKTFRTLNGDWGCMVVNTQGVERTGLINISDLGDVGNDSYQIVKAVGDQFSWKHRKPSSVGRLTDFNGYDHRAVPPFYTNYRTNVIKLYGQTNPIDFYLPIFLSERQSSLRLEDLEDNPVGGVTMGDMYIVGAYDGPDDQGEVFSQQLSTIIGTDAVDLHFPLNGSRDGATWDIYLCLADQNTWSGAKFWPLPEGNGAFRHFQVQAFLRDIFASMELTAVGAVRGITQQGLSSFDLRDTAASFWSTNLQSPSIFDAYGATSPVPVIAPNGNGVVMKLTCKVGTADITNFSPSMVAMALNTGTAITAAVQIVGTNSTCQTYPSTSTTTFTLAANTTYTFYVVALDTVADNVNEVQLSMNVAGHVDEGMSAATPWMNVNTQ